MNKFTIILLTSFLTLIQIANALPMFEVPASDEPNPNNANINSEYPPNDSHKFSPIDQANDTKDQKEHKSSEHSPDVLEQKPDVSERKNDVTEPKQEVAAPKPVVAIPKPEVAEPKPVVAEPKPVIAEPKSDIGEPKPDVAEPKPDVAEPKPDVAEPKNCDTVGALLSHILGHYNMGDNYEITKSGEKTLLEMFSDCEIDLT